MIRTQHDKRTRRFLAIAGAAMLAVVLSMPKAEAAEGLRDLTVMTQNLYLGSSLQPALEAQTQEEFVEAVARIYATVQYTNFPARAEAIADEIEAAQPDLIGLQEVVEWVTEGVDPPPGYDFLAILQSALAGRGLNYSVAAVSNNAVIGPAPLVVSESICPVLEGPTFTCSVTLRDRDVILVNDDTPALSWSNPQSGQYVAQAVVPLPVGNVSFDRGWATIDVDLNGVPFRFANTHLETEDFPAVQLAQAGEFISGPGLGVGVIAVGDFNSAADGSTTDSYALLTAPGNYLDAWDEGASGPGWTCCQRSNTPPLAPGALNNPVSTLDTRIDLILSYGTVRKFDELLLVGDTPFQAEPPFWPSDHAGVVAFFGFEDVARFQVTKTFSDNNDAEVDVTLTCNSGLPLKQTQTIHGGGPGVTFVVTEITPGVTDCEVTESGGPSGYTAVMNGGEGCSWTDIPGGFANCAIVNTANDGTFTVTKEWVIPNEEVGNDIMEKALVTIHCTREIDGGLYRPNLGHWTISDWLEDGEPLTATVDTLTGPASCWATERMLRSFVEVSHDCQPRDIPAGGSSNCTMTNTVFFENIPTLNQYGLALLALLMLGVGAVGLRRFA